MKKIQEGIYQYGAELKNPSDRSLVLVHPWYGEGINNLRAWNIFDYSSYSLHSSEDSYLYNLYNLLYKSSDRNLFLFEEKPKRNVEKTCKRIIGLRKSDIGIYAICTKSDDPTPSRSTWESVLDFIYNFSNKIDVAGGYVWGEKNNQGCAGHVYMRLKDNNFDVRLVDSCCFK